MHRFCGEKTCCSKKNSKIGLTYDLQFVKSTLLFLVVGALNIGTSSSFPKDIVITKRGIYIVIIENIATSYPTRIEEFPTVLRRSLR